MAEDKIKVVGNISTESIFSGGVDESVFAEDVASSGTAELDAFYNNEQKILNRTSEDFIDSMYENATKDNTVAKVSNWVGEKIYTDFETDTDFSTSDDDVLRILSQSGLDIKYAKTIKDAKSLGEREFRLQRAMHENQIDTQINETLTNNDRTTSSIVGAVADVDMMLGLGVGVMYSASASMAKIMAFEAAAEATIASTHMLFDESYTLEDGIVDATIGLGVAFTTSGLIKAFKTNKSDVKAGYDAVMEQERSLNARYDAVTPSAKPDSTVTIVDGQIVFRDKGVSLRQSTLDIIEAGKQKQMDARVKGFTKVDNAIETRKIKSDAIDETLRANNKTEIAENRKNFFSQQKDITAKQIDFNNMVDDIMLDFSETIDNIKLNIQSTNVEWMKANRQNVDEIATRYPKEFGDIKKLMDTKLSGKNIVDKDIIVGGKKLSKKEKAVLVAAIVAMPSVAVGSEGEDIKDELVGIFIGGIVLLLLGTRGKNMLKNANLKETAKKLLKTDVAKTMEDASNKAEFNASPMKKDIDSAEVSIRETIAEKAHTSLTSTIAPLQKAGGEVAKLAEKLLYSARNGFGIENIRQQRILSAIGRYKTAEKTALKQYKALKRVGGKTNNILDDVSIEKQFRLEVTDYMESRLSKTDDVEYPDVVKDFAKVVDKEFDAMYKYNIDNGTFGFIPRKLKNGKMSNTLEYKEGMIPRLWKNDIHDWIRKESNRCSN